MHKGLSAEPRGRGRASVVLRGCCLGLLVASSIFVLLSLCSFGVSVENFLDPLRTTLRARSLQEYHVQLVTLEQHRLELYGSTYVSIFFGSRYNSTP